MNLLKQIGQAILVVLILAALGAVVVFGVLPNMFHP